MRQPSRRGAATIESIVTVPLTVVTTLAIVGLARYCSYQLTTMSAARGAARAAAAAAMAGEDAEAPALVAANGMQALTLGIGDLCEDHTDAACAERAWRARREAGSAQVELKDEGTYMEVVVRARAPEATLLQIAALDDLELRARGMMPKVE